MKALQQSDSIRQLLENLKDGLASIYGERLKGIYLFGSYARGENKDDSDIDIMIILDNYESYGQEINRTGSLISSVSIKYGISISRIIIKESQWKNSDTPLLRNIRVEGILA